MSEVEERGLTLGLHALKPRERDVFAIWDLHLYFEMEGSFADHVASAPDKFDWLEDTLKRIGDLGSLTLIRKLRELNGELSSNADTICLEYSNRSDFRWKCLEQYLQTQGFTLEWEAATPNNKLQRTRGGSFGEQ